LKTESEKGRFLSLEELQYIFPCPTSGDGNNGRDNNSATAERITLPDQRDHGKAEAFRNGVVPYFLFFQHLRKAGGTNFCSLAESNLKKNELPKYYCSTYAVYYYYLNLLYFLFEKAEKKASFVISMFLSLSFF